MKTYSGLTMVTGLVVGLVLWFRYDAIAGSVVHQIYACVVCLTFVACFYVLGRALECFGNNDPPRDDAHTHQEKTP